MWDFSCLIRGHWSISLKIRYSVSKGRVVRRRVVGGMLEELVG